MSLWCLNSLRAYFCIQHCLEKNGWKLILANLTNLFQVKYCHHITSSMDYLHYLCLKYSTIGAFIIMLQSLNQEICRQTCSYLQSLGYSASECSNFVFHCSSYLSLLSFWLESFIRIDLPTYLKCTSEKVYFILSLNLLWEGSKTVQIGSHSICCQDCLHNGNDYSILILLIIYQVQISYRFAFRVIVINNLGQL